MIMLIKLFLSWLVSAPEREREAHFADAADLADLECRMRSWDRHPHAFRG